MTKTGVEIRDVAIRDYVRINRTYNYPITGPVIEKAWLTVKLRESAPDSEKLFQKVITLSATPDGQITDADATNGNLAMYFEILEADTVEARVGIPYRFDIKVKWQGVAKVHTLEKGKMYFIRGVTAASS